MKIQTFQYHEKKGWSTEQFPEWDSKNTLVIIFSDPNLAQASEAIETLQKHYPKSIMIGCSAAGEIAGSNILDNSFSVAVVKFEQTHLKSTRAKIESPEHSEAVGKEIIDALYADDLKGVFILSDGLNVNGSELVKGLNLHAEDLKDLVITGGLAGDGDRFQKTWEIYNGETIENSVLGVGFYGEHIHIGHASRGGWDQFGLERTVTRAKDNILYELDGKPALDLYKEYLGERAKELPASALLFPLAIRESTHSKTELVRTILGINETDKSLTFAGDIPVGWKAKLMRANFERLIMSAEEAGQVALETMKSGHDHGDMLCIAISCVGRRLLLGERTEEEVEGLMDIFPENTTQIGFYSYGEISPYTTGKCDLHNQTMTLTTFSEF